MLLQAMLGIFQKLMASRTHDQDGFKILEALLNSSPPDTLQPYMAMVCGPCSHVPSDSHELIHRSVCECSACTKSACSWISCSMHLIC